MNASTSAFANRSAEQPDEDVIRQVLDGNTAMFELLMRRYNERVYRAARAIVRDEQEAEDVMQQAYVNAFTHLRQFNGAARFSTWLTRIAVNESLARVRRRGRYETFDDELSNVEPFVSPNVPENPERQAFTGELHGLLEWAIDTLPDGMREVFVLREVEGLSTSQRRSLWTCRRMSSRPVCHEGVRRCDAFCWRALARPHPTPFGSTVLVVIGSSRRSLPGLPHNVLDDAASVIWSRSECRDGMRLDCIRAARAH
jgi:RNA polymerase sigma factor (sigma-70 family)